MGRRRSVVSASPSEVLIFRDYPGWEEPSLSMPFGFVSLRNLAVMGAFGLLSGLTYRLIIPDNVDVERDWLPLCAALSPILLGVVLGMAIKTPFGTADTTMLAVLLLVLSRLDGGAKIRERPKRQARKSRVLGFPPRLQVGAPEDDEMTQKITCSDLDELKSLRIVLHGGDGVVLGNRLVGCYLDDELIDTLRTSAEGSLVLHMRPGAEGGRLLTIRDCPEGGGGGGVLLLRKPLYFERRAAG